MCVCCASGMVDIEAEIPRVTYTYVDESYIRGHHVSKDFCTPVINKVCSDRQATEGKFWGRAHAQKNQLLLVVTTDWKNYGYCKGQPSLF